MVGGHLLKTHIKLKKDQAAIVFAPEGVQLVFPEGSDMASHVVLATSIVLALQYDAFLSYLAGFTQMIAKQNAEASTH